MKQHGKITAIILAACCILSSCVKHTGINVPEEELDTWRGNLPENAVQKGGCVSIDKIASFIGDEKLSKEVKFTVNGGSDQEKYSTAELRKKLKYDVDFYIVNYYTQYGLTDSRILTPSIVYARALLLVPKGIPENEARLAIYCHGTVLPVPEITGLINMGTPADFTGENGSEDVTSCALPLASAGYVVVCPEYTGYGPTADKDHPFVYYPELMMSAYDSIIAAQKALTRKEYGINLNLPHTMNGRTDLYICGWSQGGGLALFMQRAIEKTPTYNFRYNVKATSTLAGPFNVYRFLTEMLKNGDHTYLVMALYGWAGYSINMFCPELQRPMDLIFRPSIYDQNDAFILFGNTPNDLFQQFFVQHILDGSDEDFINALKKDSTNEGWTPGAPVFLHHGEEDSFVPCFNSEDAYNGLKDKAVRGITFYKYIEEDHATFVPAYMSRTIDEFNSIK